MAKRKADFGALTRRTHQTTKGLAKKDRSREIEAAEESSKRAQRPLHTIKPRPAGDTRKLNVEHVIGLAESIAVLGLIEPLVVDIKGRLLAGGHRLAACLMLAASPEERIEILLALFPPSSAKRKQHEERIHNLHLGSFDPKLVPVRVFAFDSLEDPERSLLIETSENTQRRDYTSHEVVNLYQKLRKQGYTDRPGKPKAGEKAAKPAIAVVIGRSVRTVRRILKEAEQGDANVNAELEDSIMAGESLYRALVRFQKSLDQIPPSPTSKALQERWCNTKNLQKNIKNTIGQLQQLRE